MKCFKLLLVVSALTLGACSESNDGPDGFTISFDLERGRFDVALEDGTLVLEHAFAEVEVGRPGEENQVFRTTDGYTRSASTGQENDALGTADRVEMRCTGLSEAPDLELVVATYPGKPFFTVAVQAHNPGEVEMVLARLVPAKVEAARRGALWLGEHPSEHRILEAGSFFLFEFFVDLVPGDIEEQVETVGLGFLHGYQKGHSISNWNHAIKDLATGRAFVAGSLDFEYASPMFNTSFDPDKAEPSEGRTPFTYWSAEFPCMPNGKTLGPGDTLRAGPVWILPDTDRPLEGLEAYASAVKAFNGIRLWPERGAGHRVPTGWNSWTGSGSSGGYGADIDEQLMLDNLQAMADEFRDFGGEWFQIDDGYEYFYGDWDWREDRFPQGSVWMAEQIEVQGLIPGLWIAPFQVDENSQTYSEHADDGWFAERSPVAGGDKEILDLTHPEVLAWLEERFRKIRSEGYRWIKTDFVYYALGAERFYDPTVTREEAYRRGLAAIRDGLDAGARDAGGSAGDTFWLTVSMTGPNMGHVDSIRSNLDTMPAWEQDRPDQGRKMAQGFKPTVRTIARRYYLQNRTWIFNHDMLFFRSHPDPLVPPVTPDEARCLATAVGLSGSVAKLGERLVEMEPDWINDYRRLIPVFGRGARPLDLFEREYPEIWHLHVVPSEGMNTGGSGPAYDVVALFNWGTNRDLTTNPYTEMPDAERTLSLDLETIGLDPAAEYVAREFWSGEVIEPVRVSLTRTVQPHTVQLFALRRKEEHPQYIGGNRHILQGAVEVRSIEWNADTKTLSMTYDAAPGSSKAPFTHQLAFHLPSGWSPEHLTASGALPGTLRDWSEGRVLNVSFEVEYRQDVEIDLVSSSP